MTEKEKERLYGSTRRKNRGLLRNILFDSQVKQMDKIAKKRRKNEPKPIPQLRKKG
jgi:hypothetical protein